MGFLSSIIGSVAGKSGENPPPRPRTLEEIVAAAEAAMQDHSLSVFEKHTVITQLSSDTAAIGLKNLGVKSLTAQMQIEGLLIRLETPEFFMSLTKKQIRQATKDSVLFMLRMDHFIRSRQNPAPCPRNGGGLRL